MLNNGFNIKKKTKPQDVPVVAPIRLSAFDQGESDEETQTSMAPQNTSRSSLKTMELDEDDEVYDYDGIYDAMKSVDREAAKAKEIDTRERKPKYMQNLLEMAEVRKRDRLRAEDVKIQREREAEGDEFLDKEKFVTSAYRAQQEELRKVEAEEAAKEAKLRSSGGGFSAFSQSLLENDRRRREAAVQASLAAKRSTNVNTDADDDQAESQTGIIAKAESMLGRKIAVNDDDKIVDHRQLLGAGLNKSTKSTDHLLASNLATKPKRIHDKVEREERQKQLERQQRMVDQQLQELRKREADEELTKQDSIRDQLKRTKTEGEVSSARERYLARKKAEAEAKAKSELNATELKCRVHGPEAD